MGVRAYTDLCTPMCAHAVVCRWESIWQEGFFGPGVLCSYHGLCDQNRKITECQALYLKSNTSCLHVFFVTEGKINSEL